MFLHPLLYLVLLLLFLPHIEVLPKWAAALIGDFVHQNTLKRSECENGTNVW